MERRIQSDEIHMLLHMIRLQNSSERPVINEVDRDIVEIVSSQTDSFRLLSELRIFDLQFDPHQMQPRMISKLTVQFYNFAFDEFHWNSCIWRN